MFSKPERLAEYHCLDVLRITALHSFVPEDTYVFHIIRRFVSALTALVIRFLHQLKP
jgi:hypothetical protein